MAEEILSFALPKLWDLLSQEVEKFQGLEDQVAELKTSLKALKSFVKDADAKKHTSARVKNCVEDIKEIIFDSEDIIETFILKEDLGKNGGIKKRMRRFACIIPERREMALEIRSLCTRISTVTRQMQDFGILQIIADVKDPQPSRTRLEVASKTESNLVGVEANVEKLVGYLVKEDDVQVVSMTGMGGLGKTTLARKAFHHDKVKERFDRLVWVCVSQVCDPMNVWQTILRTLRPDEEENKISAMKKATLQEELFRLLETFKSLVVFDDIWEEEDWGQIKDIFPWEKGSKVLLTSRNERVAGRGEKYINFTPECLSKQDSWTLFQSIAMPKKDASEPKDVDIEMEEMGRQMLKHCQGLPLAVKVLGGMLAAKYTVHDWKRVFENIGPYLVGRTNDDNKNLLHRVLSLSFEELPGYLKLNFLYLAHFPEDYEIDVENLSYFWAAEGILRYNDGETIQDVGDSYIQELVSRNMVISERDNTTMRFETCHLHDVMREICISKAEEENFVQIVGNPSPTAHSPTTHSQSLSTSRRFVSQHPTTLDVEREILNSKVRSLVVVRKNRWHLDLSSISFTRLQLLRVLHLSAAEFKGGKLSDSIGKLIHLRYLNLQNAWVLSHVPSSLRNLKLLIYLNLNIGIRSSSMSNVLMGMKKLRYLALPSDMDKKTKLELGDLVNLETLINFSTEHCNVEDLCGMGRLRTLGIILTGESGLETLSATISGLRHLENLDIYYKGAKRMKEWRTLFDFNSLKQLKLIIHSPLLSGEIEFPSRLTCLKIYRSRLEEDPMPILEKLGHLKEVNLQPDSFCAKKMVCSANGFRKLQKLQLYGLRELEELIIEEGSMPHLHTLSISYCQKLKDFSDGLRFIYSLKQLELDDVWEERLSKGGEYYYKVQHIPSIKYYYVTHKS